ncbi:rust resistance kinase Lr10-like [Daucus carota subsp. sativus]
MVNLNEMANQMLKLAAFVIACSSITTRLEGFTENGKCRAARCGKTDIRFPFHLKHSAEDPCVFPSGFQLSCDKTYKNVLAPTIKFEYEASTSLPGLYLSFSVQASVASIDYRSRQLYFEALSVVVTQNYYHFHNNHSNRNHYTFKPFVLTDGTSIQIQLFGRVHSCNDYTYHNCSSTSDLSRFHRSINPSFPEIIGTVPSLRSHNRQIYAICSLLDTAEVPLTSCTKLYNISHVPYTVGGLTWSGPDCSDCEVKGQYCKFRRNSKIFTECYPKGSLHILLLTVGAIIFGLLTIVALCYAIKFFKQKKRYQLKVETFLEDYRALKPSRYTYADIKKITNEFNVKLGEGGYGSVFKGQISNDVVVAVKILNDKLGAKGSGEDFINEVGTIGLVHHVNVVRLVGYCADGCRRALVHEFQPNNSLEKFVYRKNRNQGFLGWEKMQNIALGIAKGIEYLHQGCAQRILHFDIKPHNILLDQNFTPKISDFGLAKLCNKEQSMISMTMARGTIGYIAPEVFSRNFGKVSTKSDVYSYGMLLLEMVGAKDHTSVGAEKSSAYFPA